MVDSHDFLTPNRPGQMNTFMFPIDSENRSFPQIHYTNKIPKVCKVGRSRIRVASEAQLGPNLPIDMHGKMFAGLLLTIFLSISILRSESQAKVVPGPDRMQRGVGLVRRDWPMQLTQDQKHLISQFLPHLYASELVPMGNNLNEDDTHFPNWMDFGRRSSEDQDGDA
ncbi:hypothetical protein E2320_002741 [Naja naja]|nr:hypothetical protein E2320_002741 [Naja naja]